MTKKFFLHDKWNLKIVNNNGSETSLTVNDVVEAKVPGTVHTDLLNAGLIDDPYYTDNELKLGWISDCDWVYSTNFDLPAELEDKNITLNFDGLDTICAVILNGTLLGKTENMFLKHSFRISDIVKAKNNSLEVKFYSPVNYAKAQQEKHGKIPVPSETNSERVYIRKAQYSFGWDWGPSFPTMGIWRPVYLSEADQPAISNIDFRTIHIENNKAEVKLSFNVNNNQNNKLRAKVILSYEGKKIEIEESLSSHTLFDTVINVENPKLWWPNGYGNQNLYELRIQLLDENNSVICEETRLVGIRTIKLELGKEGKSIFRFIINGHRIYVKGVNWIPGDSFLPRVSSEKYARLLTLAREASVNMVRVWGGGIYENDEFYNLCDQLGLLVWQDFMFACGSFPEHEEFLNSVKSEVEYNVLRLRNHPSIAIWCGNNENEWIWSFQQDSHYSQMPGYKIYKEIIPSILALLDDRPYWQSSPFGFDKDPNSQTSGNRHQWYIWSGWVDYTKVTDDNSLFVTEFGFQGPADIDTFKKYIPEPNRKIHDRIFEFHNKQVEGPERIIKFLSGHLPLPNSWEDFMYLAQLNQAFALKACLEHWRLNQPVTNGSIIWQLNDTWPVTSWSLIDSELNPKMSYYFVGQTFRTITLSFKKSEEKISLYLVDDISSFEGNADVSIVQAETGEIVKKVLISISSRIQGITLLKEFAKDKISVNQNWIIVATLYDRDKKIIGRNFYVSDKWKYLTLAKANISYSLENDKLKLMTDKPAYFVDVYLPGSTLDDRGFILLPDEEKELVISNYDGNVDKKQIKIFSLNDYLSK